MAGNCPGKGLMIVYDLTMQAESMRRSVVDLSCASASLSSNISLLIPSFLNYNNSNYALGLYARIYRQMTSLIPEGN